MINKILKNIIVGLTLLIIIITSFSAYIYIKASNYKDYPIKGDNQIFQKIGIEKNYDKLSNYLLDQMTLDEKIDQLSGEKAFFGWIKFIVNYAVNGVFPHVYVGENERLGIPPLVGSDGPRGARVIKKESKGVTTFPVAIARGASWDLNLEKKINEVIAIEMRANGANYAFTPCINLLRHPGWGRAQETYGEDPWLLGEFGVAATKSYKKHNVMACPKHYALNSIENSRWFVDVKIKERALREVYLPHFKKVVKKGETPSLMTAYNSVNGYYMSENKYLLDDILRKEWGFKGFVSSDWFYGTHNTKNGIIAGMDIEMPVHNHYSHEKIKNAIEKGEISENLIDKNVLRILKTRLPYAFEKDIIKYDKSLIASKKHTELALEAALKSMVLIKNENILPFKKDKNVKIALIGRLANEKNVGDEGSSNSKSRYVISPYEGLKNYHKNLNNNIILNTGENLESAIDDAKKSDQVILIVGYASNEEGEYVPAISMNMQSNVLESSKQGKLIGDKGTGGDRESLNLNNKDITLIKEISKVNKNLVVVYIGSSAINMKEWNDLAPSILFSWYGGMEGGNAIAKVLYGDYNPSGKLPFSIAKNENDYPYFNPYTMKTDYGYYHGYTLFDKNNIEPLYPFGYGLSYTSFKLKDLKVNTPKIKKTDTLSFSIDIENTGEIQGEEVIQLYVGFSNSSIDRPVKLLRGFKKVLLKHGEIKKVDFNLNPDDLAYYNVENKKWEIEKMKYEIYIGSSSNKNDLLKSSFVIK